MADHFVLLHAPVLGPASWGPVAGQLARAGHRVVVPSLAGFAAGGPPFAARLVRLAGAQIQVAKADRVVLVVHSGAGTFAPYLADAIAASPVIVVFADAALPPRAGDAAVSTATDATFLPVLRELASDGTVPPWPRWWGEDAMAALIPDEQVRRPVLDEADPLPLAAFEEVLPPQPASWRSCYPGYLRFSESYAELAREAASRGWPIAEVPGEHLHMLVEPAEVASALVGLVARIAATGNR